MAKWRVWRPSEVQRLRALVGELPMADVISSWNRWAARQGIPRRSAISLRKKSASLGVSTVPRGAWISIGEACRLLQRSRGCLCNWIHAGWVRRRSGTLQRASLQQLARERPHLFAGCPADGLLELLQDQCLADEILAAHPTGRAIARRPHAVECVTTGQVFPSMRAAAKALYLDNSSIGLAVRRGRSTCGLTFRLVA